MVTWQSGLRPMSVLAAVQVDLLQQKPEPKRATYDLEGDGPRKVTRRALVERSVLIISRAPECRPKKPSPPWTSSFRRSVLGWHRANNPVRVRGDATLDATQLLKLCRDVLAPLVDADGGVMYLVSDDARATCTFTSRGRARAALACR